MAVVDALWALILCGDRGKGLIIVIDCDLRAQNEQNLDNTL